MRPPRSPPQSVVQHYSMVACSQGIKIGTSMFNSYKDARTGLILASLSNPAQTRGRGIWSRLERSTPRVRVTMDVTF